MSADDARRAAAERDAARADLCRFIAACYYEPDPAFVEEGLFGSIARAAGLVSPDLVPLAGELGIAFDADGLEPLRVDYTRLFLGPPAALAQPYASVWLDDRPEALMQPSTLDVGALYAEGGFEVADSFHDLPDHLAAELEFLYLLIHRENEARWAGRDEALATVLALRRRFLHQHLGRWLGKFLLALHGGAQCRFYEVLAELTEAFVRLEAARDGAAPG